MQYPSASLSSQPFIATLNYINSSDIYHPNKLHIHIEIPHEVSSKHLGSNTILSYLKYYPEIYHRNAIYTFSRDWGGGKNL